jgi:hypothetical protein
VLIDSLKAYRAVQVRFLVACFSLQENCLLLATLAFGCNLFLSKGKQFIKSLTILRLYLASN